MRVSAVIVTRGDVDLEPILATLRQVPRIDDVVVWDNSERDDLAVWGRHAAVAEARHACTYSQDDDLVHTPAGIERILDTYTPGHIVGCMWPEWSEGARRQGIPNGYDDLAFPGSGSVYDRYVALDAARRYLDIYPYDRFFQLWCDAIIGTLAPTRNIDERFTILPAAYGPDRIAALPDAAKLKREAIMRARAVRDG